MLAEKGGETSANITDRGVISSGARLKQFVGMKLFWPIFHFTEGGHSSYHKGFLGETAFCANYRQGLISKLLLCWRGNWRCVQLARLRMEHSRGEEGGDPHRWRLAFSLQHPTGLWTLDQILRQFSLRFLEIYGEHRVSIALLKHSTASDKGYGDE